MGEDQSTSKKSPGAQGQTARPFAKPLFKPYMQRKHAAEKVVDEPIGLDLSLQGLATISPIFYNWGHISLLYLAGNSLATLPPEISKMAQLVTLDVSNNRIVQFPKELGRLHGLRDFRAGGNLLSSIPLEFGMLYQMENFDLDENPLVGQIQSIYKNSGGLGVLRYCRDNVVMSLSGREREWTYNPSGAVQEMSPELQDIVTVGSYNILCPMYATSHEFSYVPTWALQWDTRKALILQEATSYGTDILCIQEMDTASYLDYFREQFKSRADYESVFYQKTRVRAMSEGEKRAVDGCAIFWKSVSFQLVEQRCIPLSHCIFSPKTMAESEHIAGRVLNKDNIALVVVLEKEGVFIIVANAHLHWDPEFPDVKTLQTVGLVKELESIMLRYPDAGLVVCGDFNSMPNSCAYELLSKGNIKPNCRDFLGIQYDPYSGRGASHSLGLKDSYSFVNMGFTNFTPGFKGIIDYIWHNDKLVPICSLGPIDEEYASKIVGTPTHHYPSDHLILVTQFRSRSGPKIPHVTK